MRKTTHYNRDRRRRLERIHEIYPSFGKVVDVLEGQNARGKCRYKIYETGVTLVQSLRGVAITVLCPRPKQLRDWYTENGKTAPEELLTQTRRNARLGMCNF